MASAREHDRDLDLAAAAQDLHRHILAMAPDAQIDGRFAKLQSAQDHFIEEGWKARIAQPDLGAFRVEFEPKRRLEQGERRRARPGLRRTGDRIERRPAMLLAPEAAKQFRQ